MLFFGGGVLKFQIHPNPISDHVWLNGGYIRKWYIWLHRKKAHVLANLVLKGILCDPLEDLGISRDSPCNSSQSQGSPAAEAVPERMPYASIPRSSRWTFANQCSNQWNWLMCQAKDLSGVVWNRSWRISMISSKKCRDERCNPLLRTRFAKLQKLYRKGCEEVPAPSL